MSSKWRAVVSLMVGVVVLVGCEVVPETVAVRSPQYRPECPHDYPRTESTNAVRNFAGAHANIPEFHDCQRMIEEVDGELRYGPLLSVHARGLPINEREALDIPAEVRGRTVALVSRPDSLDKLDYPPFGITESFQAGCVVVNDSDAYLHPIELREICLDTYDVRALISEGATPLRVIQARGPGTPTVAVARWGFDSEAKLQYIATLCDTSWCYIGPNDGFNPDPRYDAPAGSPPPGTGPHGADDWQYLAEMHDLGNGNTELRPSQNIGRVAPHVDMEHTTKPDYHGKWVKTALVSVEPGVGSYNRKFGFVASESGENVSTISICYTDSTGTCRPSWWQKFKRHECGLKEDYDPDEIQEEWYARIESPGAPTRYFCVHYRNHMIDVPPLTRWRWLPEDETIWVRCPYGCCEVAVITKGGAES